MEMEEGKLLVIPTKIVKYGDYLKYIHIAVTVRHGNWRISILRFLSMYELSNWGQLRYN